MNTKQLFTSLVENAIDFAEKSLEELKKKNPKHSLIAFCTALELFLKARLMLEHWTLLVSNPTNAKLQNFENGDFHSVSMEQALERLNDIAGEAFLPQEKRIFRSIREQRNKMVHFFDPTTGASVRDLEKVAAQEYSGWFHLHMILTNRWEQHFKRFHDDIERLSERLHQLREFLKIKFKELAHEIDDEKKKGIKHKACPRCSFKAYRRLGQQSSPPDSELSVVRCMVCELNELVLTIECPNCKRAVEIRDMAEGVCDKCECQIDAKQLVELLSSKAGWKDDPDTAYCTDCENTEAETVVPISDDEGYICLSCFGRFSHIGQCGFCGSRNAGEINPVDSYVAGCVMCSGMAAEDHT